MYYFYYAHLARRFLITGREYMGLCENINLVSDWIGQNCVEDFVFHRNGFIFTAQVSVITFSSYKSKQAIL